MLQKAEDAGVLHIAADAVRPILRDEESGSRAGATPTAMIDALAASSSTIPISI